MSGDLVACNPRQRYNIRSSGIQGLCSSCHVKFNLQPCPFSAFYCEPTEGFQLEGQTGGSSEEWLVARTAMPPSPWVTLQSQSKHM